MKIKWFAGAFFAAAVLISAANCAAGGARGSETGFEAGCESGSESAVESESVEAMIESVESASVQEKYEILRKYRQDDSVGQVLVIRHTQDSKANAEFYVKQKDGWTCLFSSDAFIGRNGMGKEQEGDGKTPYGEFEILTGFGIKADPGTALPYINVQPTTFACDEECQYYNRIIDTKETGHDCTGEEMFRYAPDYDYGMTTSYNAECIYPKGSAIFIHCKGRKEHTAGCIALDETHIVTILQHVEQGAKIYLEEYQT